MDNLRIRMVVAPRAQAIPPCWRVNLLGKMYILRRRTLVVQRKLDKFCRTTAISPWWRLDTRNASGIQPYNRLSIVEDFTR